MDKKTIPQNIGAAKKILVIDDEPHILIMVAARLRANGYETFEASFGDHGIAVAKEKHPDLILLDQIMPGMRGDEVLRVLKSTPSTKDIPVMMFTADVNKVKLG